MSPELAWKFRFGKKKFAVKNTLAYLVSVATKKKVSVIRLIPGANVIKLFCP